MTTNGATGVTEKQRRDANLGTTMYDMQIEAGKLVEFARAVHAPIADADNPDVPMTPTFLSTASHFWEPTDAETISALGFDRTRVLHGQESFTFFEPFSIGDTLRVATRLGDRYERTGRRGGRMRFATIIRSFHDLNGRIVAEQTTTLIETAPRAKQGDA
jgi:hypothetical protein